MPEYDKEAAAERQKARTKELTDKLETGMKELYNSDKYKNYLKSMSNFHNYSSKNIMLIHQQNPDATRIASYKLWTDKFNRHVKKNESGLYIYAPIAVKEPETKLMEKLDPETGAPLLDESGKVIMEEMTALPSTPRFKLVPVFDVSQTYGDPLPELIENISGDVAQYGAFIDALKAVSPLPIEFEPMQDNQDGYCEYGVKIGIRENMSETQTVCATIHEITHTRLHDKQNTAENAESKTKRVREIEAESIAYVICQHYGIETSPNSFGYLAEYGSRDMSELKASLDTVRKESNSLITAISDRFNIICKERGIDFTAKEPEQASKPLETEKPSEPTYTTETRTENIAGVDFEFNDVVPENEEKQPVGYLYFVVSDEKIPYYSDNDIIEAYKKELDSLGIWGVEFQDVADDTLKKKLFDVNSGEFGEIPEPEQKNDKISFYTLNIDSNSVPSFYDNHIDAVEAYISAPPLDGRVLGFCGDGIDFYTFAQRDGGIDRIMRDNFPLNADDGRYPELLDSLRDVERRLGAAALEDFLNNKTVSQNATENNLPDVMPDPAIGLSEMNLYGYTADGMLPLTANYAIDLFNQDFTIYLLFNDNTESMVYDSSEINNHDGIFGVERDEWVNSEQYAEMEKQIDTTAQEQNTPAADNGDIDSKIQTGGEYDMPQNEQSEPLEIPKNEQPIYPYPAEIALQSGEIDAFHASRKLNIECGRAIDQAVTDNNYELYRYDLKTAAKSVIEEFGIDRVAWVVAANVNASHNDGRFSNANKIWAREFDTPKPDAYLQTHKTVLDGFVDRFKEVVKEKPSLLETLEKNEQKSKQQFSQTPDINKEKPKIKKDGEEL